MKDEASFCLVGAVKKTFVVPSGKMAILTLETSVDGRRTLHEIKAFKEAIGYVKDLQVGEVIEVTGDIGRMNAKECEYENMPYRKGKTPGSKFYPAIPTLSNISIRRDPKMAGQNNADDDDNVPD